MKTNFRLLFLFIFIASCSTNKYASTNKVYKKQAKQFAREISRTPLNADPNTWVGTINFNLRKPGFVIIHHTAQNSCEQTLKTFTVAHSQVSAHYVICKDGTVHHMLNDYLRAWHAGVGSWGNDQDINSSSIGIELDNNGFEPFPQAQIESLLVLLENLKSTYKIPTANFIGHADIAPTRKNDPNALFPWKLLSENNFGLWYSDTTNLIVPEHFNALQGLRIIGYSIKDSAATIRAFKRHFGIQNDSTIINAADEKIIYSLMLQSQ